MLPNPPPNAEGCCCCGWPNAPVVVVLPNPPVAGRCPNRPPLVLAVLAPKAEVFEAGALC